MRQAETAIIGAGAAGLIAAGKAGRGAVLLEGSPKPGKKLLATGNGRCNLTNLNVSPEHYHGDRAAASVLEKYMPKKIFAEFESMGLLCRTDSEGRAYPYNFQAAAVLQALCCTCEQTGVSTEWDFTVENISRENGGFVIKAADGREVFAKRCILAVGGAASPRHSCAKNGYELAKALGHSVTRLSPSLAPLKTTARSCRSLKGMRCRARAALYLNGNEVYAESGEVIFGDGQLSGICIFNLSARLRGMSGNMEVRLDLLDEMQVFELVKYLKRLQGLRPEMKASELFAGVLNLRIGQELVKLCGIDRDKRLSAISGAEIEKAAQLCKNWRFPVVGTGDWDSAQVTSGGVPLAEIDLNTMESKKCAGLYLVGEMLNVDGDCGGYNLHWAWATGLAAGTAAAKK